MTTTVNVIACTDPTELYRQYAGQSEPQPAYIELDLREGTLLATYNAEIGNAVPFSVHHGFGRRYSIPLLTAQAANRVMEELRPLAERILADWHEDLDAQSNRCAYLGEDAQAAEEQIAARLGLDLGYGDVGARTQGFDEDDLVAVWPIDGATNGSETEEYGITAATGDDRLEEIEREITADMAEVSASGVAVVQGLEEYLRDLRDELAADEPRMSAAEFRVLRESLGLTGDWLAGHLGVSPRTVRHWEQGKYEVPVGIGITMRALEKEAEELAEEEAAELLEQYKTGPVPQYTVYRDDEEYLATSPEPVRTAAWHRALAARIARRAPITLTYGN